MVTQQADAPDRRLEKGLGGWTFSNIVKLTCVGGHPDVLLRPYRSLEFTFIRQQGSSTEASVS